MPSRAELRAGVEVERALLSGQTRTTPRTSTTLSFDCEVTAALLGVLEGGRKQFRLQRGAREQGVVGAQR